MGYNTSFYGNRQTITSAATIDTVTFTPNAGIAIEKKGTFYVRYQLGVTNGGSFTISVATGGHITGVTFSDISSTSLFTASEGTIDESGNWSGDAEKVTFTATEDGNLKTIAVTYTRPAPRDYLVVGDKFNFGDFLYQVTELGENRKVNILSGNDGLTDVTFPETIDYHDSTWTVGAIANQAFKDKTTLQSVSIPTSYTSLGDETFSGCTALTTVNWTGEGTNLTALGTNLFQGCSSLQELTIPASVTELGAGCFSNTALKTVTLPSTLTTISDQLFSGDEALESINIPEGVKTIGKSAFEGCKGLTSIELPAGLEEFGTRTFTNCIKLTSIVIPEKVSTIPENAFTNDSLLTDITLPDGLAYVESSAFARCKGLTSITLPDAVANIDMYAFSDCSNLKKVVLSKDLTELGIFAFDGCEAIDTVVARATDPAETKYQPFTEKTYNSAVLVVPVGSKDAYKNSDQDWKNFLKIIEEGETGLTDGDRFTIDNAVYVISDVKNLEIELIGHADGAATLNVPQTISYSNKTWTVVGVAKNAFKDDAVLTDLTITDQIDLINDNAFDGCTSLKSFTWTHTDGTEPKIQSLNTGAFSGATALTSFEIPSSVKVIGDDCFAGAGIKSLTFPASINSLGNRVCMRSTALETVTFEDGVKAIGPRMFWNCSNLSSVTIPEGVNEIGMYAFAECNSLHEVKLPSTLKEIGYNVFWMNTGLTRMDIPEGVERIYTGAFSSCENLKVLTLPSTIQTLDYSAFSDCNFDSIYVNRDVPPTADDETFSEETYSNSKLIVPAGCRNAYRLAEVCWYKFDKDNIIEKEEPKDPTGINAIYGAEANADENAPIYDLQGRRVLNPSHGIFIRNGKKFIKR